MSINAIILAAGKGTRMKSDLPKVMHTLSGVPMIEHIVRNVKKAGVQNIYLVIGHGAEYVKKHFEGDESIKFVVSEPLGTAYATNSVAPLLADKKGQTIILAGDTPLITPETIKQTIEKGVESGAVVLTAEQENPFGYGRIIRNGNGFVVSIREEKDATDLERQIKEVNTGIFSLENKLLFDLLSKVDNNNSQNEYYLTDIVEIFVNGGGLFTATSTKDFYEVSGVNDRYQLSVLESKHQSDLKMNLMKNGVTIKNPDSVYIETDVEVSSDVVIEGSVSLKGHTKISKGAFIGKGSELIDVTVGENTEILISLLEDSVVGENVKIGPYAHIRPNSFINNKAKIGNFVEIKKSNVGVGTKISHLSYIGDATIGEGVNIGCGAITVNYDGKNKYQTIIGDNAFIGCNVNMVAPVKIDANALLAAGSTITKDVPENALAIGRVRQENKKGYVK